MTTFLGSCKGLGAIPVGFKGKLNGAPFKIQAQHNIYGGVSILVVSLLNGNEIISVTGAKGEIKPKSEALYKWAVFKGNPIEAGAKTYINSGSQEFRMRKSRKVAVDKLLLSQAKKLVENLHQEVKDYKPGDKAGPLNTITMATKKKSTTKRKTRRKESTTQAKGSQTKRGLYLDKKRTAKKPGKRKSASGATYYERRKNRSDVNRRKRI